MAIKRQVFYSFHYMADSWRASQVRNIGIVEGNNPVTDNDWEGITRAGDKAIRDWIDAQMRYRSCTVVLVGSNTANRKWINYEIESSWKNRMGLVGIHIHGLKDQELKTSQMGENPFARIRFANGYKYSDFVKCYNPKGHSQAIYSWISKHISNAVEEAISIRNRYQ